jgi:small GTP-binding protein
MSAGGGGAGANGRGGGAGANGRGGGGGGGGEAADKQQNGGTKKETPLSRIAEWFIKLGKKDTELSVVLFGLDNAGKTTLLNLLSTDPAKDIVPTVGKNEAEFKFGHDFKVHLYDLGGGKSIRAIWKSFFGRAHAAIFMVDAADEIRFAQAKTELHAAMGDAMLMNKPLLILLNKQDRPGAMKASERLARPFCLSCHQAPSLRVLPALLCVWRAEFWREFAPRAVCLLCCCWQLLHVQLCKLAAATTTPAAAALGVAKLNRLPPTSPLACVPIWARVLQFCVWPHVCECVCARACAHVCVRVCACACMRVRVCVCVRARVLPRDGRASRSKHFSKSSK